MTRYDPPDRDPWEQLQRSHYDEWEAWEAEQDEEFNRQMNEATDESN